MLRVAAPFLAWRALVLASPAWYPKLSSDARTRLLAFAETALSAEAFAPESVEDVPMTGTLVWITGLPSAGKSIFARAAHAELVVRGVASCILDGDEVRSALIPKPGYDAESRDHFYETLGNLAVLLTEQSLVVLVAATAHRRVYRDAARARCQRFLEVWIDTPLEEGAAPRYEGPVRGISRWGTTCGPGRGSVEPPSLPTWSPTAGPIQTRSRGSLRCYRVTDGGLPIEVTGPARQKWATTAVTTRHTAIAAAPGGVGSERPSTERIAGLAIQAIGSRRPKAVAE